jgi:hypothetical protein
LRLVFFFGGLFALLVTETDNSSNNVGNSNHGKRIPSTTERETVNKQ